MHGSRRRRRRSSSSSSSRMLPVSCAWRLSAEQDNVRETVCDAAWTHVLGSNLDENVLCNINTTVTDGRWLQFALNRWVVCIASLKLTQTVSIESYEHCHIGIYINGSSRSLNSRRHFHLPPRHIQCLHIPCSPTCSDKKSCEIICIKIHFLG